MPAPKKNTKDVVKQTFVAQKNRNVKKEQVGLAKAKSNVVKAKEGYSTKDKTPISKFPKGTTKKEKASYAKVSKAGGKVAKAMTAYGESVRTTARTKNAFKKAYPKPRPGQFD